MSVREESCNGADFADAGREGRSQGLRASGEARKGEETEPSLRPLQRNTALPTLDCSPVGPVLEF